MEAERQRHHPDPALQQIGVRPIPSLVARRMVEREHYLHSLPAGTQLTFGVFLEAQLLGVLTFGVGPANVHRLVEGAEAADCLTLTRLWLSDKLPANSETRALGQALRELRRHTGLKFLVSYADPSQGHLGIIYQASNWVYTGVSQASPRYDLGDGRARHGRTLAHIFGTRSLRYFGDQGMSVTPVETGGQTSVLVLFA